MSLVAHSCYYGNTLACCYSFLVIIFPTKSFFTFQLVCIMENFITFVAEAILMCHFNTFPNRANYRKKREIGFSRPEHHLMCSFWELREENQTQLLYFIICVG